MEAVEDKGFDSKKGYQFSSYAGRAIKNAIINAVYDCSKTIRVPAYIQARIRNIYQAENFLWQENGSHFFFPNLIHKISKKSEIEERRGGRSFKILLSIYFAPTAGGA